MDTKLVYELDSAQCLAELPYYNRIDYTFPPPRLGTRSPNENRKGEWPKQNELNKYYNPKKRWSNSLHRWNCNQRGYEYRKPRQMKDKHSQTPKEKGSQTMEAKAHGCPKCQSCPKAPKEDNIPPSWFSNWMEANMTPQEDDDTAPTWFTDYMEDYKHDCPDPPIWFTRHIRYTSETPPPWFTNWRETTKTSQEDDDTAPTWFIDYMEDHKHNYLDPLARRVKENQKQIRILLIESSTTTKGLDRINKTLKEERTHPTCRPTTTKETEPILDSDAELAILANKID